MNQYTIGSSSWTLISPAGKSGACWLDEDGDGLVGLADVRVIQSITEPALADASKGRRVFRPNGNGDYLSFSALSESHGLYAICINAGSSAIISVDESIGVGVMKAHVFNTEPDGAIRAQIQNNQAELVGLKICLFLGNIALASNTTIDTWQVTLVAGHGVVVGNTICFRENGRHYQAVALVVATNLVTLDTPLDYAFTTAATGFRSTEQMNVNGSVTRQIFKVAPQAGSKWDILGCEFIITDNAAMDAGTFGGIPALTRGIVVRKKDIVYKNIFNAKTNGDLSFRCDSLEYDDRASGAGVYGVRAYRTFNIRNEIAIRLDGDLGDEFQVIIQDDLTGLISFRSGVWGHVVS